MLEVLERRQLLSTSVLGYHGDAGSTGQDLTETTLTPGDVNVNTFGKLYTAAVDGQAVAQPLYMPGQAVTVGGVTTTHNVVYVATEHDSLYAIDAVTGAVLWKDSFLVPEAALTAGGATVTVTTVANSDVNSSDTPEIGITGTPAIDPATGQLFVVAKTKQVVNGATGSPHYVQTLYKVNIATGTFAGAVIGDTTYTGPAYTYNVGPYVLDPHGAGAGVVTATVNGSSQKVVYFNSLRQFTRTGVTLYNGNVYLAYASHGDNTPYHGWILGYAESTLAATAVLNLNPDGSDDGVWQGGGKIAVDAQGNMYVETGNGTFDTTPNAAGFPQYGDYGDSFVKIAVDPTTSATSQNTNGWGLKVADYFTPYNQAALSSSDSDLGSGAPMVLPTSIGAVTLGSAAHPNLLVGAGKGGVIYLIDRNNMGHYSATTDNVVQEIGGGLGGGGSYDTPSLYYDGTHANLLYSAKADRARGFTIANGAISTTPTLSAASIGSFGGTFTTSASGTNNGVAWLVDPGNDVLRAYDPSNVSVEYYDSAQDAGRDQLPASVKFTTATVADGQVFVGTQTSLVAYGLIAPPTSAPSAPTTLAAAVVSNAQINLTWHDTATNAFGYYVEESTDGGNSWTQIATTGSSGASYSVAGLTPGTTYSFRVRAYNSLGTSAYTSAVTQTTSNATVVPNFPAGFAAAASQLTINGAAKINGSNLELTDGNGSEASSAFTDAAVNVQGFNTSFNFQQTTASGDGFTFAIQNAGANVVGASGAALGYATSVTPSVAVKFDLYSNSGEGADSTGLFVGGDTPTLPVGYSPVEKSVDLSSTAINLHSGDPMSANLAYNGKTLTETITDLTTKGTFTTTYAINIPSYVGGGYAYVGFTAATGGATAVQNVNAWTYATVAVAPYTPINFTATPASGTELDLSWNDSYSTVTNYNLLELTNGSYTQVAQVPGTTTNYDVTGLSNDTTYSFEVVAVNSTGSSAPAGPITGTTPVPPADISNLQYGGLTTSAVSLTWTDNATNATGYKVVRQLESDNSQYVTTLPSTATGFGDTGLLPGREYDYEITAVNLAGPSDGVDVVVETIPAAPATPTAAASGTAVTLSWAAYGHAVSSYNVYRGTTPGGEAATPVATGVTATAYVDAGLSPNTTYYYKITAIDAGGEGAQSAEASARTAAAVPVVLAGSAQYLRLATDGTDLDVYANATGTGTPAQVIALSSVSTLTVAPTAAGAATVTVDFSAGDPLPAAGLTVNGSAAGVQLALSVVGTAGSDAGAVNGSAVTVNGVPINYTGLTGIAFAGGAGSDTLTQSAQPAGGATLAFVNPTAADALTVTGGTYAVAAPAAGAGVVATTLGTLSVGTGGAVVLSSAAARTDRTVLVLNTLALNGSLDVGRNDLIVHAGSLAGVTAAAASGRLTSSAIAADPTRLAAVGVIADDDGTGTRLYGAGTSLGLFDGQDPADGDVLVRYTVYGDANLDGRVDGRDYARVDAGFNAGLTGWANGDFNCDGRVDGSDYTLIDNAFNTQPAATTPSVVAAPTAEVAAAKPARRPSSAFAALPTSAEATPAAAGATAGTWADDVLTLTEPHAAFDKLTLA